MRRLESLVDCLGSLWRRRGFGRDGVYAGGRLVALSFPFALRAGTLAASPGRAILYRLYHRTTVPLVLTSSTLTHFER